MDILFLVIGLLTGGAIAVFIWITMQKELKKQQTNEQQQTTLYIQALSSKEALQSKVADLQQEIQDYKQRLEEKESVIQTHIASLAQYRTQNANMQEKLEIHKQEVQEVREQLYKDFKLTAESILEEKTKKFSEVNEEKLGNILNPLKEKIHTFEKKVDETYHNETREKENLRKELEQIISINKQMSDDAQRLTSALKGDSKVQGDWGEIQLETLLEKTGLIRGIQFFKQPNYKTEDGANVRPDYIINLPEEKNFIIDSKVSLTAYENYFNTENDEQRANYLKEHINSINRHIHDLSSKNYQHLYAVNSPDYVFLYVALEPALTIALQNDPALFEKALNKNIVLVSSSTLLASMRTVSFIWKQENQKNNVLEIAKESGLLYDKFVGFTEDLIKVGERIHATQDSYISAMGKLTESTRKGDTIVGRMERIRALGANTSKNMDKRLVDKVNKNEELLLDE
jgi:DNA recombination protein RmuC